MLSGDEDRIRLAYSLAFSLPGTPVLFYGEEIGMNENLEIPGRMSVRSPMQWSSERNRGFTTADEPARPLAPGDAEVAAQRRDPGSLLTWMELLIRRRRECPELGFGEMTILDARDPAVLAHRADWDDTTTSRPLVRRGAARGPARGRRSRRGRRPVRRRRAESPDGHVTVELALRPPLVRVRRPGQRVAP